MFSQTKSAFTTKWKAKHCGLQAECSLAHSKKSSGSGSESWGIWYIQDLGVLGNPAPSQWYPGPWTQTSLQLSCLASALGMASLLGLVPLVLLGCPSRMLCTGTRCWNTFGLATPCGHYCPQMDQNFKRSQGGWWLQVKAGTSPSVAAFLSDYGYLYRSTNVSSTFSHSWLLRKG